jgi:glycosyltransferase involved in cell wall biosynthesis
MMRAVGSAVLDRSSEELSLSVVVPVFNSEASIDELCERIVATMGSLAPASWELILVNDGSEDESWEHVVALSGKHREIRGLDLTRNWGQHNALLAGLHAARHEVIVTLDDDLQNPPEEIPKLLDALVPGIDVVYGIPAAVQQAAYRRWGGVAVRAIIRAMTRRRAVSLATGFRALRRALADDLPETSGRHLALDGMLRAVTDRFGSVEVDHQPRRAGRSNYSVARLARLAFTEIATDLPFRSRRAPGVRSYGVRAVTESSSSNDGRD